MGVNIKDFNTGQYKRFSQGLDKLDKLYKTSVVDLKEYSKELGNFVKQREESIINIKKIRELRENNVKS